MTSALVAWRPIGRATVPAHDLMEEYSSNLAQNLRFHRSSRRLTQKDLARLAGVSPSTISRLESGEGNWKPSTLSRIARVLKVRLEELSGAPVQREVFPSIAERRLELIEAVMALDDREMARAHPLLMNLLALAENAE